MQTAIDALIDTAYPHSLPGSFLAFILKKEDFEFTRECYLYFMTHFHPWIRHESYERLRHYYTESGLISPEVVEDFSVISFLIEKGLFEQVKAVRIPKNTNSLD